MEHTRFIGLDTHKERISVAVEYLGEIINEPGAIGKLCDRLRRPGKPLVSRAATAFIANSQASAIGATWWRLC